MYLEKKIFWWECNVSEKKNFWLKIYLEKIRLQAKSKD
jgi:hypothetical protein